MYLNHKEGTLNWGYVGSKETTQLSLSNLIEVYMKKSTRKTARKVIRKSANGLRKKPSAKRTLKAKSTNGVRKAKKTVSRKTKSTTKSTDKQTMREFSTKSLARVRILSPKEIKKIREGAKVSQSVFAAHLNISSSAVKKWETGEKKPHGTSLKLLSIVSKKGLSAIY